MKKLMAALFCLTVATHPWEMALAQTLGDSVAAVEDAITAEQEEEDEDKVLEDVLIEVKHDQFTLNPHHQTGEGETPEEKVTSMFVHRQKQADGTYTHKVLTKEQFDTLKRQDKPVRNWGDLYHPHVRAQIQSAVLDAKENGPKFIPASWKKFAEAHKEYHITYNTSQGQIPNDNIQEGIGRLEKLPKPDLAAFNNARTRLEIYNLKEGFNNLSTIKEKANFAKDIGSEIPYNIWKRPGKGASLYDWANSLQTLFDTKYKKLNIEQAREVIAKYNVAVENQKLLSLLKAHQSNDEKFNTERNKLAHANTFIKIGENDVRPFRKLSEDQQSNLANSLPSINNSAPKNTRLAYDPIQNASMSLDSYIAKENPVLAVAVNKNGVDPKQFKGLSLSGVVLNQCDVYGCEYSINGEKVKLAKDMRQSGKGYPARFIALKKTLADLENAKTALSKTKQEVARVGEGDITLFKDLESSNLFREWAPNEFNATKEYINDKANYDSWYNNPFGRVSKPDQMLPDSIVNFVEKFKDLDLQSFNEIISTLESKYNNFKQKTAQLPSLETQVNNLRTLERQQAASLNIEGFKVQVIDNSGTLKNWDELTQQQQDDLLSKFPVITPGNYVLIGKDGALIPKVKSAMNKVVWNNADEYTKVALRALQAKGVEIPNDISKIKCDGNGCSINGQFYNSAPAGLYMNLEAKRMDGLMNALKQRDQSEFTKLEESVVKDEIGYAALDIKLSNLKFIPQSQKDELRNKMKESSVTQSFKAAIDNAKTIQDIYQVLARLDKIDTNVLSYENKKYLQLYGGKAIKSLADKQNQSPKPPKDNTETQLPPKPPQDSFFPPVDEAPSRAVGFPRAPQSPLIPPAPEDKKQLQLYQPKGDTWSSKPPKDDTEAPRPPKPPKPPKDDTGTPRPPQPPKAPTAQGASAPAQSAAESKAKTGGIFARAKQTWQDIFGRKEKPSERAPQLKKSKKDKKGKKKNLDEEDNSEE